MVNIEIAIGMWWSPHNPFTLRSGGVWCLADHKFGKVCSIILRSFAKKKVQNCLQAQKGLLYVAQRFVVTDNNSLMAIWIPKVRIIEVSPRRQTSVVFQNMPNHPCLRTSGQHSSVRTHKFLGRYSDQHRFSARRAIELPAHKVCCIVAATPWACPMHMAGNRCTTTIGRNKFKG